VTVTVTGTGTAVTGPAITVSVGDATTTAAPAAATAATPPAAGVDFGSCSVPEIEFGPGFDNRRETSFQPKDQSKQAQT